MPLSTLLIPAVLATGPAVQAPTLPPPPPVLPDPVFAATDPAAEDTIPSPPQTPAPPSAPATASLPAASGAPAPTRTPAPTTPPAGAVVPSSAPVVQMQLSRAEVDEASAARHGGRAVDRVDLARYEESYRMMKLRGNLLLTAAIPAGVLTGGFAAILADDFYIGDDTTRAHRIAFGVGLGLGTATLTIVGVDTLIKARRYKEQNLHFALSPRRGGAQVGAQFSF